MSLALPVQSRMLSKVWRARTVAPRFFQHDRRVRLIAVKDVPLDQVEGIPVELADKLKQLWITSAEQVVATGATPGGAAALADHLGVSETEVADLIARAREQLSPEIAVEMETPVDTSEYGLGAIRPQKRRNEPHE
jgi:hypothetical protein